MREIFESKQGVGYLERRGTVGGRQLARGRVPGRSPKAEGGGIRWCGPRIARSPRFFAEVGFTARAVESPSFARSPRSEGLGFAVGELGQPCKRPVEDTSLQGGEAVSWASACEGVAPETTADWSSLPSRSNGCRSGEEARGSRSVARQRQKARIQVSRRPLGAPPRRLRRGAGWSQRARRGDSNFG